MRLAGIFATGAVIAAATSYALAQNAEAEKVIVANERVVNESVVKGNIAGFKEHVAADAWSIDSMMGRTPVSDFLNQFEAMAKDMKISSWDMTESKVQWVDANTAIHTYKWSGSGTYQGQPIPSPVWASTIWTKKAGKWMAVFHQESFSMPMPGK